MDGSRMTLGDWSAGVLADLISLLSLVIRVGRDFLHIFPLCKSRKVRMTTHQFYEYFVKKKHKKAKKNDTVPLSPVLFS